MSSIPTGGSAVRRTERTNNQKLVAWMNEIIQNLNLQLGMAEQETSGTDRKQPDIIVRRNAEGSQIVLVLELKNPAFNVFNEDELVEPARKKASRRSAPYFATCNFRELVCFNTESANRMVPLEGQIVQRYVLSDIADPNEIEETAIRASIWRGLERFLQDLSEIVSGRKAEPRHAIDELLVYRLQSIIGVLTILYRQVIKQKADTDGRFAKDLRQWFRDQGWSFVGQKEDYDKAARQTAYLLVNKILFYDAVQPVRRLDPLEIPKGLTTGDVLQSTLQAFFREILKIDYETVYSTDFIDQVAFPNSIEVVESIKELVSMLGRYDFSKIGYDIIGRIFERLIPSEERHILGQYFTSADLVDFILRSCLRSEKDVVLDPSCGAGTFLVRSYQHKKLRNQRLLHEEILPTLWGTDIAKFPAHLTTINLAVNDLRSNENYPRVLKKDFFDLLPSSVHFPVPERVEEFKGLGAVLKTIDRPDHFDCIVGNPPYTRHLEIEDIQEDEAASYKDEIIIKALRGSDGRPTAEISRRAGIYAYFFVHGTKFLREGGRFGFVVSNSWLDADYGKGLQEHFLNNYKILAVIESKVERWFEDAEINTAVVLLEKCSGADGQVERDANLVRFVYLLKPLRHFIPSAEGGWAQEIGRLDATDALVKTIFAQRDYYENEELRVFPKLQSELFAEGYDEKYKRYDGSKWGVYVRAPKIFFTLLARAAQKLGPLRDFATIGEGKPTGAEEFFFPTNETALDHEIEDRFLQPGILKARGFYALELCPSALTHKFLVVDDRRAALKKTRALEYIKSGERDHLHLRNTFASKKDWYRLSWRKPADLLMSRGVGERHYCILNSAKAISSGSFTEITLDDSKTSRHLWAFLNSSVAWLFMELSGRRQMGGGMLKLDPTDLRKMLVVKPDLLPDEILIAMRPLQDRPIEKVRDELRHQDRRAFDRYVLSELFSASEEEQKELYAVLEDLIGSRADKARSVKGNRVKEGIDLDLLAEEVLAKFRQAGLQEAVCEALATSDGPIRLLPRKLRSADITETLYGWQLSVDDANIECADEETARYLFVFVELGFDKIKVPRQAEARRTQAARIIQAFDKSAALLKEVSQGLAQPKLRVRLRRIVWERFRQEALHPVMSKHTEKRGPDKFMGI